MNIDEIRVDLSAGLVIGAAIATVPLAVTSLIACSKIIIVNVIAELAVRILSLNTLTLAELIPTDLVKVPLLWKASFICLKAGLAICVLTTILAVAATVIPSSSQNKANAAV